MLVVIPLRQGFVGQGLVRARCARFLLFKNLHFTLKTFSEMVCYASVAAVKHVESKNVSDYVSNAEGMSNVEIIETLRSDIATIDNDIVLCEKQRKAWIAATVIGGIRIVGTGVFAIKQANTLSDKKAEYNELKTQVNTATKAADSVERFSN